jgi:hypothetical protein
MHHHATASSSTLSQEHSVRSPLSPIPRYNPLPPALRYCPGIMLSPCCQASVSSQHTYEQLPVTHNNSMPVLASNSAGSNHVERPRHIHPASDDIRPVKKTKHDSISSGTRGQPVARNYNDLGKAVLSMAQLRYEAYVCAHWLYLSVNQQIQWAKDSWARVCRDKGADGDLTENVVKLVCILTTLCYLLLSLCSLLLTRHIFEDQCGMLLDHLSRYILVYSLQTRTNHILHKTITVMSNIFWTIAAFVVRYAYLDHSLWILTSAGQNPDIKEGEFEHPIIQDVLNNLLFKNWRSHGVVHRQKFTSKLPLVTFTLILTAVCTNYIYICCIEWL